MSRRETKDIAELSLGGQRLEVSLELIDQERASEYLSTNQRNRKPTESQMMNIQRALKNDEWCLNGATIVFDSQGELSDGQHRLAAVARTGIPILTLVVRGVEPLVAQDTTDNTRKRTLASQLQMRGENNYKSLASAINAYWQLTNIGAVGPSSGHYPTPTSGLRFLERHPNIRHSVSLANRVKERPVKYPAGLAGALHYAFAEKSPDDADAFWMRLADGSGLTTGDPLFALRERMISDATRGASVQGMGTRYRAAITIKAWNAWMNGDELKLLKWRPGGANPEAFPAISGPDPEDSNGTEGGN